MATSQKSDGKRVPAGNDRTPAQEPALAQPTEDPVPTGGVIAAGWHGPLPPPSVVEGYGRAVGNGSERLFRKFELEAEHRRRMEAERLSAQRAQIGFIRAERRLAQGLAGLYAFSALGLAAYALHLGFPIAAGFIGTTSIASVVAAFLASSGRAAVSSRPVAEKTKPSASASRRAGPPPA